MLRRSEHQKPDNGAVAKDESRARDSSHSNGEGRQRTSALAVRPFDHRIRTAVKLRFQKLLDHRALNIE